MKRIRPVDMFHTPADWPELERWLTSLPPSERPTAITAAMMAWNLACSLVTPEEEINRQREIDEIDAMTG